MMNILLIALTFLLSGIIPMQVSFAESVDGNDSAAELYFYRCAGCHTIGGGNLTGPDLIAAAKWSDEDLHNATKRMEKNVGALTQDEIVQLVAFIKDLSVTERLAALKQKIETKTRSELPAPSFQKGRELFVGEKPLANGGPACMACHQFVTEGGSLGPDLTAIKNKSSGVVLQSGIENANYLIMRPIYEKHRITKEESLHLAEYLTNPEKVTHSFVAKPFDVMRYAWMGFGVFFILLWNLNRRRKGNTRDKLFNKSTKG